MEPYRSAVTGECPHCQGYDLPRRRSTPLTMHKGGDAWEGFPNVQTLQTLRA